MRREVQASPATKNRQNMQPGREVKLNFKKSNEMITGPGGDADSLV